MGQVNIQSIGKVGLWLLFKKNVGKVGLRWIRKSGNIANRIGKVTLLPIGKVGMSEK